MARVKCREVACFLPTRWLECARMELPRYVELVGLSREFSVNNQSGLIDRGAFLSSVDELLNHTMRWKPTLIIGDPGVQAGIIADVLRVPVVGLMHGCYLNCPPALVNGTNPFRNLAGGLWRRVHAELDALVQVGSRGAISSWESLRRRGEILVPESPPSLAAYGEGTYIGRLQPERRESASFKSSCLITTCSAGGTGNLNPKLLRALVASFGGVTVAGGSVTTSLAPTVRYVGQRYALSSLIDNNTRIITHGGHGTLQALRGVKHVVVVPTDVDQLCNGLIECFRNGWHLAVTEETVARLTGSRPFVRELVWTDGLVRHVLEVIHRADTEGHRPPSFSSPVF
ncbi:MAG: hypothetical protein HY914_05945 [Desulfomonile tiedjei]|nr:hypothetical protein [Desulfomonile tiedjei]